MSPRPAPQPVFPTRARASVPARIRTLALAFSFAVFVLLVWGAMRDTAYAEDVAEPGPVTATSDEAVATPEPDPQPAAEAVAEEIALVEEVAPVEEPTPATAAVEAPVDDPMVIEEPPVEEPVVVIEEPLVVIEEPLVVIEAPVVPASIVAEKAAVVQGAPADDEESTVTIALVAPPAVHQCNADTFPTSAGWEATCVVTVENTIGSDGATSSTVTTVWCLAEAGVLPPEGCDSDVVTNDQLVTTIDQCNGILAGGSNVTCTVEVVNNVPFGTPTTGVTVNQCIGSGQGGVSPGGPPTNCDPEDSSTSGATVTQCNGSANGGGGPERVQCTVDGAVTAVPVTVNQCNGSTAAGSTVTCQVTFTNNFAAAVVDPDTTTTTTPTPAPTPPPVATTNSSPVGDDTVRTVSFGPGSPSGASFGGNADSTATATARATSLAATGASVATLFAMALMLLLLGGLLLAGSNRRSA